MDKAEVQALIDDAMAGAGEQFASQAQSAATEAVEQHVVNFRRSVEQLGGRVDELAKGPAGEGMTAEAVASLVTETVGQAFAERDERAAADAEAKAVDAAKAKARADFIAERAGKLPEAYRSHIPETDDREQLEAGLAKAVEALQADAKAYGWRLPDLGAAAGGDGGEEPPKPEKGDEELRAMSPAEREAYLRDSTPGAGQK